MPVNKNAYIRYQVLDSCFGNFGRKYFWEDLLEKINLILSENDIDGIGRTQLFKDIRFMESEAGFAIPLERYKDGRKVYYRYNDKNFSIRNSPINQQESESIKSALSVLSRFKGLPQFEWINELIPVLKDKLGFKNKEKQVILFDSNIDYKGIEYIEPIFNAITYERVLEITYQDFKSHAAYSFKFHPYILKQYNNRWFVLGRNHEYNIPTWNLALDRIKSIKECNSEYIKFEYDWEDDYFYDIIGVTMIKNSKIEKVVLQFSKDIAPYIKTKPIHPTQSKPVFSENGYMTISIKVIPNYELERLILSFGDKVKIISPDSVKNIIVSRIKNSFNQYLD